MWKISIDFLTTTFLEQARCLFQQVVAAMARLQQKLIAGMCEQCEIVVLCSFLAGMVMVCLGVMLTPWADNVADHLATWWAGLWRKKGD